MLVHDAIDCVLFDLDGTLVDTAPDMVGALNTLRAEERLPPGDYARLSRYVSRGAAGLLDAGMPAADETVLASWTARFLEIYRQRVSRDSRLFDGLAVVLERIEGRGWSWGVVTNKPTYLSEAVLTDLGLAPRLATLVCGDTLDRKKPDPAPLLHACAQVGISPGAAVYIGDDRRDIVAGKAAGCATVAAAYGYLVPGEDPASWDADATVDSAPGIACVLGLERVAV